MRKLVPMAKGKKAHLDTSSQTLGGGALIPPSQAAAKKEDPSFAATVIEIAVHVDESAPSGASTFGSGSFGGAEVGPLPERIGRYKILRLVGAGGMGAVYEAEQDQPRRTVALKVMRGALSSPQASRRFEYESQLLARLRHPGIAQVYDAGTHTEATTGLAVPYFAMEFIPDAKELTSYANDHKLDREGRISLFQRVCDAVQHGHQRGIIHRDLKPANILVDPAGNPKIIDFGVARASAEEGAARVTQQTTPGQLIGTLQYMAPEQCGSDSTDIDVRADVYALGVILYELLTGRAPYELEGRSLFEAAMMVREDAPTRPSTIVRELRGDLETILYKALEKDRVRRYDSAADFAADLTRHLKCEPIMARNIGVGGRLARWVKRNRTVATVIAASAAVLITTSVVLVARILSESRRANNALLVAQQNLQAAKDNFTLIRNMFAGIKPEETQGGLVDVGRLLDSAADGLNNQEPEQPVTQADFREFLGEAYRGVGQYAKEVEIRRRAVEIRERLVDGPDSDLATSLHNYAAALWWNGEYDKALPIYKRALAMRITLHGNEHEEVAQTLTHLAACQLKQDQVDEAQKLYEQALAMRQKLSNGAPNREIAASLNNMSKPYSMRGEYDKAEGYLRQSLNMIRGLNGDEDLFAVTAELNLALCLLEQGKSDEATALFRHAHQRRAARYRMGHPQLANAQIALARGLFETERSESAAAMAKEATVWLEAPKRPSPELAESLGQTGLMYAQLGDLDQAMSLLERSQKVYADAQQSTARDRAEGKLRLGLGLAYLGQDALAEETLRPALEGLGPQMVTPSLRAAAASALAAIYDRESKTDAAAMARSWGQAPTK